MSETRRVLILGSTGSVGTAALDVAASLGEACRVAGLSAHGRWREMAAQVRRFRPDRVAMEDAGAAEALRQELGTDGTEILSGPGATEQLVESTDADMVLVSVVGSAALRPVLAAIRRGVRYLALANKESVVMAGHLVTGQARERGVEILPVDSEHSAIFQALRAGARAEVGRVILTASGGPFRGKRPESLTHVTPAQALDHPTWKMGTKVTIDSATLMNKALEIIEARWLFDLHATQIAVVIHPESIVHSFVEFRDGTLIAQMGRPDMRAPIQFALTYPARVAAAGSALDLAGFGRLSFERADETFYPALALGRRAAEWGGTAGAVLNAANEVAGQAFLSQRIRLPDICRIVDRVLSRHRVMPNPGLDDILEADRWARGEAETCLNS